jgi:hypothetical protein
MARYAARWRHAVSHSARGIGHLPAHPATPPVTGGSSALGQGASQPGHYI